MEAFMNRALLLQSQSLPTEENLQQLLRKLIEGGRESWSYAIFWLSTYDYSGASILRWGDGYYNFYKVKEDKAKDKAPKTKWLSAEQAHRKKVISKLNSLFSYPSDMEEEISDMEEEISDMEEEISNMEEISDMEWFFLLSMTQSFVNGSSLPGHAFLNLSPIWVTGPNRLSKLACDRARQGQMFGIQTLVCIPSANGVVELASTEVILPNPDLMNKVLDLFNPVLASWPLLAVRVRQGIKEMSDFTYPIGLPRLQVDQHQHHAPQPLRKDKRSREKANSEIWNCENDNLSKKSHGKEKISDSKCSWSLLSDSSDRGTDRTFSYSHDYSGPS